MSFLYDPKVMINIIKSAFEKEAQSPAFQAKQQQVQQNADAMDPSAVADAVNSGAFQSQKADELKTKLNPQQSPVRQGTTVVESHLAKKLVDRLSAELSGVTVPVSVTGKDGALGLQQSNLVNLNSLLKYMDTNQIKVDGTQVVYNKAVSQSLSPEQQANLSAVTDFVVDLDLLVKYVDYLQQKSVTDKNKPLENMLARLVAEINVIKPDSGLTAAPKVQQNTTQQSAVNPNDARALARIAKEIKDTLPLSLYDIDFVRIRNFFKELQRIDNSSFNSINQEIESKMQAASGCTARNSTVFSMNLDINSFYSSLRDNDTRLRWPLHTALTDVVRLAYEAVSLLMSTKPQYVSSIMSDLQDQNGILRRNLNNLDRIKPELDK